MNPPSDACSLNAHFSLPRSIFPDKYQLSQPNLLLANGLVGIRSLSPAAPDLEAPVWAVKEWGSTLLLELSPRSNSPEPDGWHVDVPLHLRYLPPSSTTGHRNLIVPDPVVFWACSDEYDGPELHTNPFDRKYLGYDTLFGPRTLFYHLQNSGSERYQILQAPVLDLSRSEWIEAGTAIIVLVGTAWVVWCLIRVAFHRRGSNMQSIQDNKKSQ